MSEFDDLISAADADIADAFGDAATLGSGGQQYPVQAIVEKGVSSFGPNGSVIETHISIPSPPVDLANGQTVTILTTGEVFTLREEREDDGFMPAWAATLNA